MDFKQWVEEASVLQWENRSTLNNCWRGTNWEYWHGQGLTPMEALTKNSVPR